MKLLLIIILLFLSFTAFSQQQIPLGTWEGISGSGMEFKVLKTTSSNQHFLTAYKIASGMQTFEQVTFTNKDIKCNEFDCRISTFTSEEKLNLNIILTVHSKENFLVTEAIQLKSGEILSINYELRMSRALPIPERFIVEEAKQIIEITPKFKQQRFGYWSGVLESPDDNLLKMATLKYLPNQTATFTVYTPGFSGKAVMTFKPEWLTQDNGELHTKVEGALFASKITLRYLMKNIIDGDYEQRFARYPERLISYGHFKLYRVKPKEDYHIPTRLMELLKP